MPRRINVLYPCSRTFKHYRYKNNDNNQLTFFFEI